MDKKLFKSVFCPTVRVKSSDSSKTVFEVVGVPYGGPEYLNGKDLHGERFTKSTDYGKDLNGNVVVDTIYAFYDHAMNDAIGKDQIGYAKFFQETDEGQLWEIEVMRAYRYHDMLLALAQKNLLGASSQPVQTAVEIDYETGDIKRWYPAEISLTPTPANPNAVAQVMKSFNMEYKLEDVVEEDKNKDTELENKQEEEVEKPADDLASEIENAFKDGEQEEVLDAKSVQATLDAMVKSLETLTAAVEEIKSTQAKSIKETALEITKVGAGVKALAFNIAKSKGAAVKTQLEQELEGEVDNEQEQQPRRPVKSAIPANAPGMRKN